MKINQIIIWTAAALCTFCIGIAGGAVVKVTTSLLSALISVGQISDRPTAQVEQLQLQVLPAISNGVIAEEIVEQEDAPVEEFYAEGSFYLETETIPKEFSDIDFLEIITHDYEKTRGDGTSGLPIPPKGGISTKKRLDFVRIAINGRELAFQTETVNGVSYRFTGKYPKYEHTETSAETPDLVGQLIKIRDGKWAASMKAKFYMSGC